MGSEWREVTLGDVCRIRRGSSPRPIVDFLSETEGMPWVKIADATESDSRFIDKTKQFIKKEGVCKSVIVEAGDLILSNSGTAGLPKFMSITACIHDGWQVLKDLDGITSEYLYYTLLYIRLLLLHNAYDSTMKNLTLDMVREAKVQLPPLSEQEAIAHILSSLDDKIELNRRMNETLEGMAQTLFKSWFVDFDPVIDNALIAGHEIPEPLRERAETRRKAIDEGKVNREIAKEFPDKFQLDEDLGWIPEGWGVKHANEIADISIGKTPPRKETKWFSNSSSGNIVWVSIKDLGNTFVFIKQSSEYLTKESIERFNINVVPEGSVILSFKLTLGRVAITDSPLATNEAIAHFKVLNNGLSKEYIYSYLKQFNYDALGSTSSIATAVNSKIIKAMKWLVPPNEIVQEFDSKSHIFFTSIKINENQRQTLTKLRDTLLPKLISGELRIPDAEKMVEEALS